MDYAKASLELHAKNKGKIAVVSKVKLENRDDLSTAYTPGVATPCLEIQKNPELAYKYTAKGNLVAVVSDGTAVLGLGNIGGLAGMPVMEGKAILFKEFGGVDAFPICLSTQDPQEVIRVVKAIAPTFGGINLEDIKAPECFIVEETLKRELDIPVFHDDQHGTAIIVLAALMNALKVVKKDAKSITVVINGAGAAGTACAKLLMRYGVKEIIMCDRHGIIYEGDKALDSAKQELARHTNRRKIKGTLADAMKGADLFIGVSAAGCVTKEMVKSMGSKPIVFALANPTPEIMPDEAKAGGAAVIGTGRSDYPNQINNVLAFPGVFRGALDARAKQITEEMKIAAANAIANYIPAKELSAEKILPSPLDRGVAKAVADAVRKTALSSGVGRRS
jgi:malate dehydrogenase (oxaloacetate-decarboxylating)